VSTVGARPEDLQLVPGEDAGVQLVERLGAESLVHLELRGAPGAVSVLSTDRGLAFGQRRTLRLDGRHLHRFDARGQRLAP
jgi:ABC-type sugar transport system ATPase subunit